MISSEHKIDVLEGLLSSVAFSKSTTSNVLLRYLIESSISGKDLNATDIALELFASHYEPEKSEATVRVNVYHLRKKLDKYYETEGAADPIHIAIKRGQYGVHFYKKENPKVGIARWKKLLLAAIAICILLLSPYLFKKITYKDPVWNSLFKNDKETTLYLYDIFGYYGPTLFNDIGWHRDYEINSPEDFYREVEKHPEFLEDYSPGRNIYVNFLSAYSVNDLSKHFYRHNREFKIHKFHNLSFQQLKEQNSIYLGPLRYDNAFVDFFNLKSKRVKLIERIQNKSNLEADFFDGQDAAYNEGRNILYKDASKHMDTLIELKSNGNKDEHILVAKLKGDNDTSNLLFFSNHGFGATAAIEYFTNIDSIASFNSKYLQFSEEFIVLFHVTGKERTSMNIRQVLFDNNN